jgi:hypothetical protein
VFLGNRTVTGGTTLTVDFSADSIVLLSAPTNAVTISLTNYTAGAQVKVVVRMPTAHNIATGVAAAVNSSTGATTVTAGGPGGTVNNQSVILDYICVDGTSANTYVAINYV